MSASFEEKTVRPVKTIILGVVLFAFVIGCLWLANAPISPPVQKIEQVLPDDRISH